MLRNLKKINIIIFITVVSIGVFIYIFNNKDIEEYDDANSLDQYIPYKLDKPDNIYKLPNSLREISGISFYKKNKIACVQDEEAQLFIFDLKSKEISKKYKYGKGGDFEGVELVGEVVYLLRSDGRIYAIENYKSKKYEKKLFKTMLTSKNNCEGLCYDKISNSLLIACKGASHIDKDDSNKDFKAIYQFKLSENKLKKKPFLLIDLNMIFDNSKLNSYDELSHKLARELNSSGDIRFQPSGIAIHPILGHLYVIASVGKRLVIFDRNGGIISIQKFKESLFRQPEGICFAPNGDLFISNESKNGKATILKFKYIP